MGKAINEIDSYSGSVSDTTLIPVSDSDTLKASTALKLWMYIKSKADTVYSTFSGAYADLTGKPTLGTAAALNHGTAAGNLVRLDATTAKLPAVDGSLLTGLPTPDLASPGPIGGTTPSTMAATSLTTSVQISGVSALPKMFGFVGTKFANSMQIDGLVGYRDLSGTAIALFNTVNAGTGFALRSDMGLSWSDTATSDDLSSLNNVILQYKCDASDISAQRRGTNAQTARLYGTFIDASNGRWLESSITSAGVAVIKPTGNGTGASGNVLHISGLPTSNPGPGILWNNSGSVAIGT